jgi:hypothetical protein
VAELGERGLSADAWMSRFELYFCTELHIDSNSNLA